MSHLCPLLTRSLPQLVATLKERNSLDLELYTYARGLVPLTSAWRSSRVIQRALPALSPGQRQSLGRRSCCCICYPFPCSAVASDADAVAKRWQTSSEFLHSRAAGLRSAVLFW